MNNLDNLTTTMVTTTTKQSPIGSTTNKTLTKISIPLTIEGVSYEKQKNMPVSGFLRFLKQVKLQESTRIYVKTVKSFK